MSKKFILPSIIMLSVFSLDQVYSTTWYVHPDSILNSIQAGLDSCTTNDTVLVGPGTYHENLRFQAENVIVSSSHGPEETVILAKNAESTVLIETNHEGEPYLIGFTITGGHGRGLPDFMGGGISCINSSPYIDRCIIQENRAEYAGGGICLRDDCNPWIRNCILYDNLAYELGGGIAYFDSRPRIAHCTFYGNIGGSQGGAVHCENLSGDLCNLIIWGNASPSKPSISFKNCNALRIFSS